jgi:hypothetical protein
VFVNLVLVTVGSSGALPLWFLCSELHVNVNVQPELEWGTQLVDTMTVIQCAFTLDIQKNDIANIITDFGG